LVGLTDICRWTVRQDILYVKAVLLFTEEGNDCIRPFRDVVTSAGMTAGGRVVAPVGISGIQTTRSKNHVVLTVNLVEPAETFIYMGEVLETGTRKIFYSAAAGGSRTQAGLPASR